MMNEPMVLGHEAVGNMTEIGKDVKELVVGDQVCMEPGIPNTRSKVGKLESYNVDPSVRFSLPVHGCLTPAIVCPTAFTFKLPDYISFAEDADEDADEDAAEDAMVEPGCGGAAASIQTAVEAAAPTGCVVWVGMPVDDPLPVDLVFTQSKELRMGTVFRYTNMYDRATALLGSRILDLNLLISETFSFVDSIAAFDRTVEARPMDVKTQIKLERR